MTIQRDDAMARVDVATVTNAQYEAHLATVPDAQRLLNIIYDVRRQLTTATQEQDDVSQQLGGAERRIDEGGNSLSPKRSQIC